MSEHPVVVAAFRSAEEASAARSFLVREKIPANMMPRQDAIERLCPDVFDDGYDVIVGSDDAAGAIALLQRIWPDESAIDVQVVTTCLSCGSTAVLHVPRIRIFLIASVVLVGISLVVGERDLFLLVIGIIGVALLLAPANRCRSCGEIWR
jgi:hypothetical protein